MIKAIVFALFLVGCAISPNEGMIVYWHKHESRDDLHKACNARLYKDSPIGCAQKAGNVCRIHTRTDDAELHDTLGHELRHCFEGAFH